MYLTSFGFFAQIVYLCLRILGNMPYNEPYQGLALAVTCLGLAFSLDSLPRKETP